MLEILTPNIAEDIGPVKTPSTDSEALALAKAENEARAKTARPPK